MKIFAVLLIAGLACVAGAKTVYVDNVKGADSNPGTSDRPFASIKRGLNVLATSDRMEVVNNPGRPYTLPYPGPTGESYQIKAGGTPQSPLVINGNGAVISGLAVIPAEKWQPVTAKVYKLPFWPMSNLYRTDKRFDYWNPRLKIWFVDGNSIPNTMSRDEMEKTPNSMWWSRAEKAVYFRLPEDRKIEDLKIELPANSGFYTEADHCRIENFISIFSWNDGFDTSSSPRNTLYKNCIAVDNCGQGFSCHGESLAVYEDCIAIRNGSSGACNAHNSQASYIRCIFADNVFEAGVFNYDTANSRLYDCLIVDSHPDEQIWAHGNGSFMFSNCVIKTPDDKHPVLYARNGTITMVRCTVSGGQYFNTIPPGGLSTIVLTECLIGNMKDYLFDLIPAQYRLSKNIYFNIPQFRIGKQTFPAAEFAKYQTTGKTDIGSTYRASLPVNNPRTGIPDAVKTAAMRIGAVLPESVWSQYEKYKNVRTTPTGLIF